jgi:hypothetical protein
VRRSNCHLEAWRKYRAGEAVGFCFHPTRFARLELVAQHWAWLPLRVLGAMLQWVCWPLTHLGELLRSGRWYHVTWVDREGQHWEFVMTDDQGEYDERTRAFAPPLVFRGAVRRVGDG